MLTNFAGPDEPLRASRLPDLVRCSWRAVMIHMGERDSSGKAADTGSAVHKAAATWHDNGHDVKEALRVMRGSAGDFPFADLDDAEEHFRLYARDPRNIQAKVVLNEKKLLFTLPPHKEDPTGQLIHIQGTCDQVREVAQGEFRAYDIKHSKKEGWALIHHYAIQIAAYCWGATHELAQVVGPGAIIKTRGYKVVPRGQRKPRDPETQPPGVFFEFPWRATDLPALLLGVRKKVAEIRAGDAYPGPGETCDFCLLGGLEGCVPRVREEVASGRLPLTMLGTLA